MFNLNHASIKFIPQKILVVDDEQQVCEFIAEALTFLGHSVITASNGWEALEELEKETFSLVIADMDMPLMDGMELIHNIVRGNSRTPDIIAITGHSMTYRYTDVVAAGAVDFITKPFTLDELEAKVNRIVRERQMRAELERLAVRDPLTGLYNRRFFQKVAYREAIRSVRYRTSLFMLYLDVDYFKEYNDQHGHNAGDALLIRLGELLNASIRNGVDTAFRFGGDEFTVLLTSLGSGEDSGLEQAMMIARRIRENYNKLGQSPTTLSIGLSIFTKGDGEIQEDIGRMIHQADLALYHVKNELHGDNIHFFQQQGAG